MTTSRPVRRPPSVRTSMRWRRPFSMRIAWVSASPSSHGDPACLIDDSGEAPVPPIKHAGSPWALGLRSEELTSELQSRLHLVCRLLLEKKNKYRLHVEMLSAFIRSRPSYPAGPHTRQLLRQAHLLRNPVLLDKRSLQQLDART